jgi:hypothetical protein
MRAKFWSLAFALTSALALLSGPSIRSFGAETALPEWSFGSVGNELKDGPLRREQPDSESYSLPANIQFYFWLRLPEGSSSQGWTVAKTSDVRANGSRLSEHSVSHPDDPTLQYLFYRIDPCEVADLDTPGTEIGITYDFVFGVSPPVTATPIGPSAQTAFNPPPQKGSFVLKLAPDTADPELLVVQASRTRVHRDETVQIALKASDESEKLGGNVVWDSGLRTFRLEGDANPGEAGRWAKAISQTMPQSCAEKVKEAEDRFSYTVPHGAQPGDEITLWASVEDWAGRQSKQKIVLTVVETKPDEDKQTSAFPPRMGCADTHETIYRFQGIEGRCDSWLNICGDELKIACPKGTWNLATYEDGPEVCCDDWRQARQTKKPCDVSKDADCDGIKNTEDRDPLRPGNSPPPR